METYSIIRFYKDGRDSEATQTGLTLDEAQEHCRDESTITDEYFDGYESE